MLTFKIRTEYMKCIACPSPQKRSRERIEEGVKHNTKTADNINDTNNKINSDIFFISPLLMAMMWNNAQTIDTYVRWEGKVLSIAIKKMDSSSRQLQTINCVTCRDNTILQITRFIICEPQHLALDSKSQLIAWGTSIFWQGSMATWNQNMAVDAALHL